MLQEGSRSVIHRAAVWVVSSPQPRRLDILGGGVLHLSHGGGIGVFHVTGSYPARFRSGVTATAALAVVLVVATLTTVLLTSMQAPVEVDWVLQRVLNV